MSRAYEELHSKIVKILNELKEEAKSKDPKKTAIGNFEFWSVMNLNDASVFAEMVKLLLKIQKEAKGKVSRKEYDRFCREYIFDVLANNVPFGVAFCERFDINDFLLNSILEEDIERCKRFIEESGYINDTYSN
jgi:hypothetical protein